MRRSRGQVASRWRERVRGAMNGGLGRWSWLVVGAAWAMVSGCADDGVPSTADMRPEGRYALVDLRSLTLAPASEDPFAAAHRPAEVDCAAEAYGWELFEASDSYYVETWRCNYHAAQGSSIAEIRAGDVGIVRLFNFELQGPEGSMAHLGLAIDGDVVWESELPIPGPAAFISDRWVARRGYAIGASVVLEVNNHGANSYQFQEFAIIVGDP